MTARSQPLGLVDTAELPRRLTGPIPIAALAAALFLLVLGQGTTFFQDEWNVIEHRGWTIYGLFVPHNEHWPTVLVVIYLGLVGLFGLGSYLPFQVVLVVSHLFAASGVYALVSRAGAGQYAVGATILFLFLGAGAENLLWAFQIGFILATGLGCWALALAPSRPAVSAVLLTFAVATQGVGLFYLAATGVRLLGSRAVLWLALPVGAYLAWFLTWGLPAMDTHEGALTGQAFADLAPYVALGVASAIGGVLNLGAIGGVVIAAVSAIALWGQQLSRWTLAALAGLLVQYGLIGLVRAQMSVEQATASRYVYVAVPFVLLAGVQVWRRVDPRLGPVLVAIGLVMSAIGFVQVRSTWPGV